MNETCRIEFDRADRTYRSGEVVRGEVVVYTDEGVYCEEVSLLHYWRTHGKGRTDRGDRTVLRLHEGPLQGEPPHRIPFELPAPGGPFTYHGALLNVDHYLEARVELPGLFDAGLPEDFLLVPGPDVDPPHPSLRKATGTRAAGTRGCRIVIGALLLFIGFFTLPFGLLFMVPGLFLAFPPLTRALAGARIGEVDSAAEPTTVAPGSSVRIRVRLAPRKDRKINAATAVLRGRELVVYGKGSDRGVDTQEIFRREFSLSGPRDLSRGRPAMLHADVEIPEEAAPTFTSKNNEVTWDVRVSVDIPSWPDWHREHKLVVWPRPSDARRERPALDTDREVPALPADTARRRPDSPVELGHPTGKIAPPAPEPRLTEEVDAPAADPRLTEEVGAPAADPGPEATTPAAGDAPPLATAVRSILAEKSFGGGRDPLVRELIGTRFTFPLEVGLVKHTFGAGPDPTYRHGRTVEGTVAGTDVSLAVRFPADRNEELDRLRRGSVHTVTARVADWKKLSERPVLEA